MRTLLPRIKDTLVRLRTGLGLSEAHGRDIDVEQAVLRVAVTVIVIAYGVWVGIARGSFSNELTIALCFGFCTGAAGLWMLYRFHRSPSRPDWLRSFGISADLVPITAGLYFAGEIGVPLVGLYLWITVGNGFRFGPRFLLQSYGLTGVCFTFLLLFSPFWREHRAIGIGLAILLAAIPLYVLVLLSRLTAQKQAAEALSNAKSRFVANVSHELRTPLVGVVAVHDLLQRRNLRHEEKQLVDQLGSSLAILRTSVDAILQMSKLEAGAERYAPIPFNIRAFSREIEKRFALQAESKQIAWHVQIDPQVPGVIVGDREHLTHVIGNLVNNAFKFTERGEVTLRLAISPRCVRFEVCDTGIGIPSDKLPHIFDRFVQADISATRRYGGTGLGTSIAHDLVKLMGGTIGVESTVGSGSRFWFEVPSPPDLPYSVPLHLSTSARDAVIVSRRLDLATRIQRQLRLHGVAGRIVPVSDVSAAALDHADARVTICLLEEADILALGDQSQVLERLTWIFASSAPLTTQSRSKLWSLGAMDVIEQVDLDDIVVWHVLTLLATTPEPASVECAQAVVPRRVLIADDNYNNLMLLTRILEEAGHSVRGVESGGLAYNLMLTNQFDIALLDFNMPDMTGPDTVALFRAGEAGTDTRLPIFIVSADATPEAAATSSAAGADLHLTKPLSATELLARVSQFTKGLPARHERRAKKRAYPRLVSSRPAEDTSPSSAAIQDRATDSPYIDATRLKELRRISGDDAGFLDRYVHASFADIDGALSELREELSADHISAARDALHKIDGTAANLGAQEIIARSKLLKDSIRQFGAAVPASAIADLVTNCAATKSAFAAILLDHNNKVPTNVLGT